MKKRKWFTSGVMVLIVIGIVGGISAVVGLKGSLSFPEKVQPTMGMMQSNMNWKQVEEIIGISGKIQPEQVFKFSLPRSDLQVKVQYVKILPALALSSWLAFRPMDDQVMVMGDLVLTEEEVHPVMECLLQGNMEVTALHNHLLGESPRIMYMHIQGHGDPVNMAKIIRSGLELTKTPLTEHRGPSSQKIELNPQQIDQILGYQGTVNNGVYQVGIPRVEKIKENGMDISPSMGTATVMNFQPTGNGKAAITGDFVLTADEVNPVMRTLRKAGIEVTALHNHMLNEKPRLFFMHFWAHDHAIKLAKSLRAALDQTNSVHK